MHRRHCGLHGANNVEIGIAVISGMDPTLEADFGCSAGIGLTGPACDLIQIDTIGRAALGFGAAF